MTQTQTTTTGMTQAEARALAKGTDGIATQESRYHGRRPKPGEPWVVVLGGVVLREVPGEVTA